MSRLIVNVAVTVNGAFEAPTPDPNGWLVLDADSQQASLDMWRAADAMLIGRKTYEGLDGDLVEGIAKLKCQHAGDLVTAGAGPLVDELLHLGLVDELWFTVSPYLWGVAPRVFDRLGAVRLDLVSATTFPAGVLRLCYRPRHSEEGATR